MRTPTETHGPRKLLTVAQVAEQLQMSRERVYDLIAAKTLVGVRFGEQTIRVHPDDLDAYIAAHRSAA